MRSLQPCEVIHMAWSQTCPQEGKGMAGFSHAPWVFAPCLSDASWTYHVLGQDWVIEGQNVGLPPFLQAQHRDLRHPLLSWQTSPKDLQCVGHSAAQHEGRVVPALKELPG